MTKTCFNLRYFNLPQTALDVLRRVANPNGEICGGEETDVYLPYSWPYADLDVTDYLKVQSDYLAKRLIQKLHSPDQVRFAKRGLSFYISDPQKRQALIAMLEIEPEHFPQVDSLECYWKDSFRFSHLRWDETLIDAALYPDNRMTCATESNLIRKSFAHYYGFSDAQLEGLPFYVNSDHIDALMRDGLRSPEAAIRLIPKDRITDVLSRFNLSKYGFSDAALTSLGKNIYSNWDGNYAEPLVMELLRLGISDPLAVLGDWDVDVKDLFQVLSRMRDNGYADDEMRWMVTQYPLISDARILGGDWLKGLADIFPRARKEGVSFKEIRWILEDSVGFVRSNYYEACIWDIFRAYCHQPHRTREAVYGLFQDYPRTMALALEPRDAGPLREHISNYGSKLIDFFINAFARRMGIGEEAARSLMESGSQLLWEFVFKHRTEAYIFDPQKMEDYRAIAKDLHNRGADNEFFKWISFEYVTPPKTIQEAAQMLHHLQAIDTKSNGWDLHYLTEAVVPLWPRLQKNYRFWQNPKTGRLDVTRHNIKQVNQLLALFSLFPFYKGNEGPSPEHLSIVAEGKWIARHLDVEEIDARHLSVELYADYFELIKRLQDLNATASSRYLSKQMLDLEAKKIFSGDMLDIARIEKIRKQSNESYPHLGDRLVDNLGIAMLEDVTATVANLPRLRQIANTWGLKKGTHDVWHDDQDLYRQYAHFAYQMMSDAILEATDQWRDDDQVEEMKEQLAASGIVLDALVDELEKEGFPIRSESDWDKVKNRIVSNPGYVVQRGMDKLFSPSSRPENLAGLRVTVASDWIRRHGVEVLVVSNQLGQEVARAIRCDRAVIGAEILLNRHALVDTEARKKELGTNYIFSAPLNMTTPDTRTMTEIAYDHGEPMNWLMTATGKDGLLLVDRQHRPKILDKRSIVLGQMLGASDLKRPDVMESIEVWKRRRKLPNLPLSSVLSQVIQPFKRFADKLLFREIMAQKSYSLLSGMLFTAGSDSHRLKSERGTASRRLFVEYANEKFGVVDGTKYLTTEEAFEAAKAAGATKAIYMDTGFWDQADYVDGRGESHRLDPGHSNSSQSTNRVVIRVK